MGSCGVVGLDDVYVPWGGRGSSEGGASTRGRAGPGPHPTRPLRQGLQGGRLWSSGPRVSSEGRWREPLAAAGEGDTVGGLDKSPSLCRTSAPRAGACPGDTRPQRPGRAARASPVPEPHLCPSAPSPSASSPAAGPRVSAHSPRRRRPRPGRSAARTCAGAISQQEPGQPGGHPRPHSGCE